MPLQADEPMSALPARDQLPIAIPLGSSDGVAQDEEWCLVRVGGAWREFRMHDYAEIYEVAGLYERLFYDVLRCASPPVVRALLAEELERAGTDPGSLRVLDLGAGNGIMAEELADLGAAAIVGVDIIHEARMAALRDRPGLYDAYEVLDMTALGPEERARLAGHGFTGLTCVAALGFGDIPPRAFATAYDLVATGGWVAFNIKADFLDGADRSGFAGLIARALESGALEERARRRYRHRDAADGSGIPYVALAGTKRSDLSALLVD